jgi:hypothetical protein
MANKLLPVVDQAMPGYELRKMRSDSEQRKSLSKQGMDVARSVGKKPASKSSSDSGSSSSSKSFSQAFREARAEGKETFTWNGKRYTTEMAGAKKDKKEESETFTKSEPDVEDTDEGRTTTFKRGGAVKSSASRRADGCAVRGKTRGKML